MLDLRRWFCVAMGIGLVLCAAAASAARDRDDEGRGELLYPVDARVAGKSYEEWTVAFLKWAYRIKKDRNPVTDGSGEFATEGQSGPVWFLGGNFGGVTVRTFSMPAGKYVFSPIVYAFPAGAPDTADPDKLLAGARHAMDGATDLKVTLDGTSLGDMTGHRLSTHAFVLDGLDREEAVHPVVAGKRLMVADGYWFMLKPLSAGKHVLRVKGKIKRGEEEEPFRVDITYEITVRAN